MTPVRPNCIGFPPSINEDCTVLILGSMPGISSLNAQQYYAHPQNRFWPMITRLLTGQDGVPAAYCERLNLLLTHHIALWDAIGSCERSGSLDSAIHHEQGNDFTQLLADYPSIHTICFNGAKSFQCFKRYNKALLARRDIRFAPLPSTSPANARWRLPQLITEWSSIIQPAALGSPS